MIDQEEITTIKQGVELVPFMRACGIELKQVGKNYRGYCPFHEDASPSLTVNPRKKEEREEKKGVKSLLDSYLCPMGVNLCKKGSVLTF